ncbi:hypothetical protein LguiB_020066 [Lonicera macranthoides]
MVAASRREKYSQSLSGSQIAVAAVIGILLGCLTAFFFLHGSFTSYIHPSKLRAYASGPCAAAPMGYVVRSLPLSDSHYAVQASNIESRPHLENL